MKTKLFLLSAVFLIFFTYFSYTVSKERWQRTDFDSTVKLQDHISRRFDGIFSYLSLLGSVEVTMGFCLVMILLSLLRRHFLAIIGWLMIIPASLGEIFGKLVLYHPGPPVFFHRSLLPTSLPSFYIHTDFSYPSGHLIRTFFILTIFLLAALSLKNHFAKMAAVFLILFFALMMTVTRIYLGEHWLSDVVGGSLLGISFGLLATALISGKINQLARVRG